MPAWRLYPSRRQKPNDAYGTVLETCLPRTRPIGNGLPRFLQVIHRPLLPTHLTPIQPFLLALIHCASVTIHYLVHIICDFCHCHFDSLVCDIWIHLLGRDELALVQPIGELWRRAAAELHIYMWSLVIVEVPSYLPVHALTALEPVLIVPRSYDDFFFNSTWPLRPVTYAFARFLGKMFVSIFSAPSRAWLVSPPKALKASLRGFMADFDSSPRLARWPSVLWGMEERTIFPPGQASGAG